MPVLGPCDRIATTSNTNVQEYGGGAEEAGMAGLGPESGTSQCSYQPSQSPGAGAGQSPASYEQQGGAQPGQHSPCFISPDQGVQVSRGSDYGNEALEKMPKIDPNILKSYISQKLCFRSSTLSSSHTRSPTAAAPRARATPASPGAPSSRPGRGPPPPPATRCPAS